MHVGYLKFYIYMGSVGAKAPMLNSTNVYGLLREALMLNSCSFPIGINWKYTVEFYVPIERRDVA